MDDSCTSAAPSPPATGEPRWPAAVSPGDEHRTSSSGPHSIELLFDAPSLDASGIVGQYEATGESATPSARLVRTIGNVIVDQSLNATAPSYPDPSLMHGFLAPNRTNSHGVQTPGAATKRISNGRESVSKQTDSPSTETSR